MTEETPRTGNAQVDAVLDSLDALEDLPVEEHVAVFEHAQEQLRAALDAPSGPQAVARSLGPQQPGS